MKYSTFEIGTIPTSLTGALLEIAVAMMPSSTRGSGMESSFTLNNIRREVVIYDRRRDYHPSS